MGAFTTTNSGNRLYTLSPNGDIYKELIGATQFQKNRIGEYKKYEMTLNTDIQSLKGLVIYLNPALFSQSSAPIPNYGSKPVGNYYSFQVDPLATPGTYDMYLTCSVGYVSDLIKNTKAEIIIDDEFNFKLVFYYYQIYDLNSFLNPALENNHDKLFKDRAANTSELVVSGTSVYNDVKTIPRFYIYICNPEMSGTFSFIRIENTLYRAGFYEKNETNTAPYFTEPSWRIESPVGTIVPSLQISQHNRVFFKCTAPVGITGMMVWMVKTNTSDNSVDFQTCYDASFAQLIGSNSDLQLSNKIWTPSQIQYAVGPQFECFFTVKKEFLAYGDKYRFIAIPYYEDPDDATDFNVNSFISDEYVITDLSKFTGVGYEFDAIISDYLNEYSGNNLRCCVEERLKGKVAIGYPDDAFSADMLARLGLTVPNDIRRYLTKVTVEAYEDLGSTIHYFDRVTSFKLDPLNYSAAAGITITAGTDLFEVFYDFRVRYESWVANLQTTVGGIPLAFPSSNQNWATRTIQIKYSLELYYDDFTTPFSDVLIFNQQIRPKNYGKPLEILNNDDTAIGIHDYYLNNSDPCFKANIETVIDSNLYKLITTVEKEPGSIAVIEENEEFAGVLPQMDSPKFLNQESTFGNTETDVAKFCLDASTFFVNSPYKVSAIAKKLYPASTRLTQDAGDRIRITQTGEYRQTQ